ncbi:MAG: alpha/beta hydrolase [Saprospiraceae bacterium]|nr:alpha/beta hydrolase [Saprospiraceae bacterium]
MNALKFILYLIIFFPGISLAQESSLKASIQKISTGALYYEYFKHSNDTEFPTIVFESGALHSSSYWNHVIDSISKHANTIRYDRAGLGRSLPSADTIRSSKQIAEELNELLDSLKVKKKIILVCHSAGGFYGRTFSHQFSNRVKTLVLIESPCTRWETLLRSSLTKNQNEERDSRLKQNRLELSFYQRKEYQASELNRIILDQIPKMQIPVFIISGNSHHWPENYNVDLLNRNWYECQKSLTNISSNSKIIIVNGAGHHIFQHFDLSHFLKNMTI